jgi:hypothetical protein
MSSLLKLPGSRAASSFRIAKIRADATQAGVALGEIAATYWHFLELGEGLDAAQMTRVRAILDYGVPAESGDVAPDCVVTPRPGTISPWSSKASDILRNCGIASLRRVERGIAWRLRDPANRALDAASRALLLPLLHDRMTEAVLDGLDAVDTLFQHVAPRALATVDVLGAGARRCLPPTPNSASRCPPTSSITWSTISAASGATRAMSS